MKNAETDRSRLPLRLHPMGLFHTPASQEEVFEWIGKLNGNERVVAWTVAGMLINLIVDRGLAE